MMGRRWIFPCTYFLLLAASISHTLAEEEVDLDYGVDVSFPMHYPHVSKEHQVFGDRQSLYEEHLQGCFDWDPEYPKPNINRAKCLDIEQERLDMNLRQPQSMINFTSTGYLKVLKAPEEAWRLVQDFWTTNRHQLVEEDTASGSVYMNHWKAPVHFLNVEDFTMVGGGAVLKEAIGNAMEPLIQEWTGQKLVGCSVYGIRQYTRGSVLMPHVDRTPLVLSAILNVDQDVDEPWPLEVIDHGGRARNVTLKPGEMILYESHSIIHGRPFPLKGNFYANLFIHFEPVAPVSEANPPYEADIPPYMLPNSPEEAYWRQRTPDGWKVAPPSDLIEGTTEVHRLVQALDFHLLATYLERNDPQQQRVNAADQFGWTPLHEAARALRGDLVRLLVERGADIHATTKDGMSALGLAYHYVGEKAPKYSSHPQDHPVIQFLEGLGAKIVWDGEEL